MLKFKTHEAAVEVHLLHPTLWTILCEIEKDIWPKITGETDLVVTDIYRDREETIAIYRRAGKTPPTLSVHEVRPTRGCDLSARSSDKGTSGDLEYRWWPLIPNEKLKEVEREINARWQYNEMDTFHVALLHEVAGIHIHLQCRPGSETKRRG